ncbi:MAG: hypothetical protein D6808_05655 [Candidatus Dadabacteria bacterium]|nr:MAG: hypothetical protein D6808_05655 [Candidatus Dadabacteria bacterium]
MSLAKYGIINGKKVRLNAIESHNWEKGDLSVFSKNMLSRLGFLRIAEKVSQGKLLSRDEISLLIRKAGLPVLLKLVKISRRYDSADHIKNKGVIPALVMNVSNIMNDRSRLDAFELAFTEYVRAIPYAQVHIAIEGLDVRRIDHKIQSMLKRVSLCRDGIALVGPNIEDMFNEEGYSSYLELREALELLRECGFKRLRTTVDKYALALCHECGFETSLVTLIDAYGNFHSLADEIILIRDLTSKKKIIDVWGPGYSEEIRSNPALRQFFDIYLLRLLAIGSICLTDIPVIRATSKYFSLASFSVALDFGANDLGYGALTGNAKKLLKLRALVELEEVATVC